MKKRQDRNIERLERKVIGITASYPEVKVWIEHDETVVVFRWPMIPVQVAQLLTEAGLQFKDEKFVIRVPLMINT